MKEGSAFSCQTHLLQHSAVVETEFFLHLSALVRVFDFLEGERRYFCDALNSVHSSLRWLDKLADEALYKTIVKYVDVRNPGEEGLKCAQALLEKTVRNAAIHLLREHIHAELEHLRKLLVHLGFEILNL